MDPEEIDIAILAAATCIIGATALLEKRRRKAKKRKCWVSYTNSLRSTYGAFNTTMAQLEVSQSEQWRNYMRMDKAMFTAILQSITTSIRRCDTKFRAAIPPAERLAVTMRYLATGESFTSLHYQFRMGKSTISTLVPDVCQAIYRCLKDQFLRVPSTNIKWAEVSKDFFSLWNFPHCIGSLDGKHVVLRKPWHSGSAYHNYKGSESIVLMAIVDARYR